MSEPGIIKLVSALLYALKIAVDEAEDWHDECRGMEPGQRLSGIEQCYLFLDAVDIKTHRETKGD